MPTWVSTLVNAIFELNRLYPTKHNPSQFTWLHAKYTHVFLFHFEALVAHKINGKKDICFWVVYITPFVRCTCLVKLHKRKCINKISSGKRLHNYGESPFLNEKVTSNGPCSIAMSALLN